MSHDAHNDIEHVKKSVKIYILIFGALLVGTIVTVLASYIHFGSTSINILVALLIASIKGFLVAGYFMHLISERKMIYGILGATIFFFGGLMYLTLWSLEPTSIIHIKH
jgi:cytochrome c oxidase subunit 4